LNGKSLTILVTNFEKHTPEIQSALDRLSSLMDNTSLGSPRELSNALKVYYGKQAPEYFKNASAGLYRSFDEISASILPVLKIVVQGPGMIYQVNTLGGRIADADLEKASCFPNRACPFLAELQTYWNSPGKEKPLLESFHEIQSIFKQNGIASHY